MSTSLLARDPGYEWVLRMVKHSNNPDLDYAIKYYRHLLRTDGSAARIKAAREEILALEGTV